MTRPGNAGAPLMVYPRMRVRMAHLSIEAYAVLHKVWLYCQDVGNGGRFHVDELPVACDRLLSPGKIRKALVELERATTEHQDGTTSPLWLSVEDDHVLMPDWWVELNPGAEVWQDDTLRWRRARNKELHSPKCQDLRERIRKRDRNLCRYCGHRVKWGANNAPHGATFDHVDPDEGNTFSNVVIACRQCNGRKSDRTPGQWIDEDPSRGLSLLPAGTTADQAAAVREARAGPSQGSTKVEPESNPGSTSPRARARDRTGSNPSRTRVEPDPGRTGSDSSRPGEHEHVPPPDDSHYPHEGDQVA